MKKGIFLLFLGCLLNSQPLLAERHSYQLTVNQHPLLVTEWSDKEKSKSAHTILLLSGPTDNWNSDSAWFARLAPKLAKTYRVISIDRAGIATDNSKAPVGYAQFGDLLKSAIPQLKTNKVHVIAFATANLALNQYLANNPEHPVRSVVMIDPDVLLPYSMSRYKSDAKPFKENLQKYVEYIGAGKYNQRALQKNDMELKHLKELAKADKDTDWSYVDQMFQKRLSISSLQNLFKEIADYEIDLDKAFKAGFPNNIPLVVIDTDFEDAFIEKAEKEEDKQGLIKWKAEAKTYYQQLADQSVKGKYMHVSTQEHLLPFSDPELLIKIIAQFTDK